MTSEHNPVDDSGIRRREVLKATGLAAIADLEAIAESAGRQTGQQDGAVHEDNEAFLTRLPAPSRTPDGRYEATLARRLDEAVLAEPGLLADADAHMSLVSERAMVTVGLGGPSATTISLEERGYQQIESIDGRSLYVRRGRYKQRVATANENAVVVGRGAEMAPVMSLVRAIAVPRSESLAERLPIVAEVRDCLGSGAVLSLSPAGRRSSHTDTPQPVASGKRLSLRASGARLRTVDVFASRAASKAALSGRNRLSLTTNMQLARDGRTVIRDTSVHDIDLPLAGDE